MTKGYAEPVETRFWKSYEAEPTSGCWIWTLNYSKDGYGLVNANRKTRQAHRVAYELAIGPIPDGMQVLHRCDTRCCVNPAHLFLGTPQDNMADRDRKGRQMRYERMWKAKLTRQDVEDIHVLYRNGMSQRKLAKRYGVWETTIADVIHGRTWKGIS